MRLMIISLQLFVVALVYSSVAGLGSGGSHVPIGLIGALFEPLIMHDLFDGLFEIVAEIASIILPFVLSLFLLLACSLVCYIRFLRWTRWVGLGVCLIAIGYSLLYLKPGPEGSSHVSASQWIYGIHFGVNAILFYAMPRWPYIELNRKGVMLANVIIAVGVTLFFCCSMSDPFSSFSLLFLISFSLSFPHIINFFASKYITFQGDSLKRQIEWLILISVINMIYIALISLLFPILAVLPTMSFLSLLLLCETQFLYNGNFPEQKNAIYYLKMAFIGNKSDQKNDPAHDG